MPGGNTEQMDDKMTVKELEHQLERLADADLDAGQLDAAVMKLGQLAAIELLAEDAAREPGDVAPSAAPPRETAWTGALGRAREQAQTDPAELHLAEMQEAEEAAPARGGGWGALLPLAGLVLMVLALLVIFGAGRAFDSTAAVPDGRSVGEQSEVSPAPAAEPSPLATRASQRAQPTARPLDAAAAEPGVASDDGEDAPCVDESGTPLPASSWLCRGRAIRGSAGAGAGESAAVAAPAGPAAPPYQIVNSMRLGMPKRVRYEVNVVVPPSSSREEIVAALTDVARKTLREKVDARAVGVFAYSSRAALGTGWDLGRALASVDGQGWTGDRTFAPAASGTRDQGRIYVTLGTTLAPGEAIEVDR
jgi:hypothetical protein